MLSTQDPPAPANPTTEQTPLAPGTSTESGDPAHLRCLVIVSREELDLWRHMTQYNGEIKGVQVLLDRRQRERRQQDQPVALERRRVDRRRQLPADEDLRRQPFLLVA
jgi:hypothetical protein